MNLYLVRQDFNDDYDSFDSFVCVANSEEEAKKIFPCYSTHSIQSAWASEEHVYVEYIGIADEKYTEPKIICSSFNAG